MNQNNQRDTDMIFLSDSNIPYQAIKGERDSDMSFLSDWDVAYLAIKRERDSDMIILSDWDILPGYKGGRILTWFFSVIEIYLTWL